MDRHFTIAIDGTAASGKSTVAKLLAAELGCGYLDTGKLYRALALDFLASLPGSPQDWLASDIESRLPEVRLTLHSPPAGECRILVREQDVNDRLAALEVEAATPFAARMPVVRDYLLEVQRDLARQQSVVMAGRDIGTVVLPQATVKVFIEADLEERARRRIAEHNPRFTQEELAQAVDALQSRDQKDAQREVAPMVIAEDALVLDSTARGPNELVDEIARVLHSRLKAARVNG